MGNDGGRDWESGRGHEQDPREAEQGESSADHAAKMRVLLARRRAGARKGGSQREVMWEAEEWNQTHPEWVAEFIRLTGRACVSIEKKESVSRFLVANWQSAHGLKADGKIGPETLELAKTAAGANVPPMLSAERSGEPPASLAASESAASPRQAASANVSPMLDAQPAGEPPAAIAQAENPAAERRRGVENGDSKGREAVAETAHVTHAAGDVAEAGKGAAEAAEEVHKMHEVLRADGEMREQLRQMRKVISAVKNRLAKQPSPKMIAKLGKRLREAEQAFEDASKEYVELHKVVPEANEFIRDFSKVREGLTATATKMKLGNALLKIEPLLASSKIGQGILRTGKILTNPAFSNALTVVASLMDGFNAYLDSTNKTRTGKVADAALAAGGTALVMARPVVAVADVLAPKGYKLSEVYHGGAQAVTALGEGVVTGDTTAMENFQEKSEHGEYGKVMQAASEAGAFWAEHGVVGGLEEFGRALKFWESGW